MQNKNTLQEVCNMLKSIKKDINMIKLDIKKTDDEINQLKCNEFKQNRDYINMNNFFSKELLIVLTYFLLSSVIYGCFMYLTTVLPTDWLNIGERASSAITTATLFFTGIWGAYYLTVSNAIKYNISNSTYAILSAPIFACYVAYVTIDFGSMFPLAAAIGFNIATILKCVIIIKLLQEKNGHRA